MSFAKYQNVPFRKIPEEDRVKHNGLAICQGGCNRLSKMYDITYQLCATCSNRWRYHGHSCDVPNCKSFADGKTSCFNKNNKIVCSACYNSWSNMDFCIWERFVESRHSFLLRPKTFVKALEQGIISPVEKDNWVKCGGIAECQHCNKESKINNAAYQLCGTCCKNFQYLGETCGVCEINDAYGFDASESIFFCKACKAAKNKYKITSYQIYKTQIRTILNCHICNTTISHDTEKGKYRSANIDHNHDTGKTRGVLCSYCNTVEGSINKMPIDALTYAKRLVEYLENPPLTKSWTQSL